MAEIQLRNLSRKWGSFVGVDGISCGIPTENCHLFEQETGVRIAG